MTIIATSGIDILPSTDSIAVVRKLKAHLERYGISDVMMSDNGPQYSAKIFKKFVADCKFQHITSSPAYSQSNGNAESAVKTAKNIRRAEMAKFDIYLAILSHRNTPNASGYKLSVYNLKPEVSVGRNSSLTAAHQRQAHYCNRHSNESGTSPEW